MFVIAFFMNYCEPRMKSLLQILLALLLINGTVFSQTDEETMSVNPLKAQKTESYFGIGVQAGLATGSGIMFRAMIPERYAFEATLGIITLEGYTYFSSGIEAQYRLNTNNNERVFLLAGAGFYYKNKGEGNIFDAPFRAGFGAGYDWFLDNRNTMLGIEVPLTLFFEDKVSIFPTPQVTFTYYFR